MFPFSSQSQSQPRGEETSRWRVASGGGSGSQQRSGGSQSFGLVRPLGRQQPSLGLGGGRRKRSHSSSLGSSSFASLAARRYSDMPLVDATSRRRQRLRGAAHPPPRRAASQSLDSASQSSTSQIARTIDVYDISATLQRMERNVEGRLADQRQEIAALRGILECFVSGQQKEAKKNEVAAVVAAAKTTTTTTTTAAAAAVSGVKAVRQAEEEMVEAKGARAELLAQFCEGPSTPRWDE